MSTEPLHGFGSQNSSAADTKDASVDPNGGDKPKGYYDDFAKHMSLRTVIRSDRLRGDEFVQEVIDLLGLPDRTADYQVVHPMSQGNDGEIFKLIINHEPHVVKIYKTGLNAQYVHLQKTLLVYRDHPDAIRHPGYEAVYYTAVPVGWVTHMDKKGLVFRYVVQPRKARSPTASDRAQVRAQMQFLHWLGFCHLDITKRNILLADNGKCYLMDFDCVCRIGKIPLGPLPPESSEPILRRDPAQLEDDLQLWQLLQGSFFTDLQPESVTIEQYKSEVDEEKKKPTACKRAWSD